MSQAKTSKKGFSRRDLLSGSAKAATLAGLGGAAVAAGTAGFAGDTALTAKQAKAAESCAAFVGPGDLDEYYGFWSGG